MSNHVQGVLLEVGTTSVNKIVVWNTKKVPEQKCLKTNLNLFSTCLSISAFTLKVHNLVQYWINEPIPGD